MKFDNVMKNEEQHGIQQCIGTWIKMWNKCQLKMIGVQYIAIETENGFQDSNILSISRRIF